MTGAANGHEVAVGNAALFTGLRMPLTAIGPEAETLRAEGATTVLVAIDGRLAGVIAVADPIKASIPAVLESLRQAGIRIVMVTGDHRAPDLPAFYGPALASEVAVSGLVVNSRCLNSAGVSWPRLEWGRTSLN